jgi:hypothetical protein
MVEQITPERATLHEALFLKLGRLLQQAEAIAARRPSAPLPAETRAAAETLLYETERFLVPRQRNRVLPPAADTFGGLATQLGQAVARLDAFEASHSAWNPQLKCIAWHAPMTGALPVRRLRPEVVAVFNPEADKKRSAEIRRMIAGRMRERYADGYVKGVKDAQNGTPMDHSSAYKSCWIAPTME